MANENDIMGYILLVLILIIALLLGVVILVQNPKGTGLASGFEGAGQALEACSAPPISSKSPLGT